VDWIILFIFVKQNQLKLETMNTIQNILRTTEFESSSVKTQQFKDFVSKFRSAFKKEMKSVGVTDVTFSVGHFYISGFFSYQGQTYYFSLSDVRGMNYVRGEIAMLYRTAEHTKDYTGGSNQWVTIGNGMAKTMLSIR
jgi:hypothetical protein